MLILLQNRIQRAVMDFAWMCRNLHCNFLGGPITHFDEQCRRRTKGQQIKENEIYTYFCIEHGTEGILQQAN